MPDFRTNEFCRIRSLLLDTVSSGQCVHKNKKIYTFLSEHIFLIHLIAEYRTPSVSIIHVWPEIDLKKNSQLYQN